MAGFFLSLSFYQWGIENEKSQTHLKYQQRAEVHAKDIEAEFKRSFYQVSSIANLFSSSSWITHLEFTDFISRVYSSFPESQRLGALLRFSPQEKDNIVQRLRENSGEHFKNFTVHDFIKGKKVFPATLIDGHYLVLAYSYPNNLPEVAGRNFNKNSPIGPFVYDVVNSNRSRVSDLMAPIKNIREEPFLIFAFPIIKKDMSGKDKVVGLVISTQLISEIFRHNIIEQESGLFDYLIVDAQQNQYRYPKNILTSKLDYQENQINDALFTFPIQIVDSEFTLVITPKNLDLLSEGSLVTELMLAGLLLSILLSYITYTIFSQQQVLEKQVKLKTSALKHQKEQLEAQNVDLENAVQEANAAVQVKADFLANMSHEIRTPLNGVIGLTDILKDTELDAYQLEYVEKLRFSGKHLLLVINDILDFSKIESGSITLEHHPFSIYSIVDYLKMSFDDLAAEKGIEFKINTENIIQSDLLGDIHRINQILLNLCSNAIKFTEKGTVTVNILMKKAVHSAHSNDYLVQFEVTDTGIGMSQFGLSKLFMPFSQADTSTTRKYGGTGLGLTISRRLCDIMGGKISVSSKEGQGSTFTANVLLKLNDQIMIEDETNHQFDSPFEILVVDDNPIALKVFTKLLSSMNLKPIVASSGADALAKLKVSGQNIEVILLDWTMPEMDGEALIGQLKQLGLAKMPQLIVITAYDRDIIRKRQASLGIHAILQKPCTSSKLYDVIKDSLTHPSLPEETPESLAGVKVLVVEDNKINQLVINKLLSNEGAISTIVSNGKEAIDALHQYHDFSIVLMDIQMPEMDGIEATKIIRRSPHKSIADVPIIALTANVMEENIETYLAIGMNDHAGKPIVIESLKAKIFKLL